MNKPNPDELMEAFAGKDVKTHGYFNHKETNAGFDYAKIGNDPVDQWGILQGFTHKVFVNDVHGSGYRYAKIKGTVAYVAVDENPDGSAKTEKWLIKKHRVFKEETETKSLHELAKEYLNRANYKVLEETGKLKND